MKFEIPRDIIKEGETKGESLETKELFKDRFFKCAKSWIRLGTAIAGIYLIVEWKKEYNENESSYRNYMSSSLSVEDQHVISRIKEQIQSIFGNFSDFVILDIEQGNREAFFEQKKEQTMPDMIGLDVKEGSYADNFKKYVLPERYLVYPSGWIRGEVDHIIFLNQRSIFGKNPIAEFRNQHHKLFGGRSLIVHCDHTKEAGGAVDKDESGKITAISKEVIDHELGHANDWTTDSSLSSRERYELLMRCYNRMISPNAYSRSDNLEYQYHEKFNDGSKEGLYTSTSEYWAEICREYFSNPREFKEKFPEDFELVDSIVRKNDPSFNILDNNRGAFDPQTGKFRGAPDER